ncbi:hypothetical protein [Methylobacterium sp. J-068]|uniref:hypothetical protein n=1 Tax=Methylobacterium sp. J-068 TaxID=2836649 RepID=UPI001FBB3A51|nr:hypothetical protein [Methylobacterium sp. J-068]MCJ2035525.1 hypothetical protein [Methylobacterium sp. J-068]
MTEVLTYVPAGIVLGIALALVFSPLGGIVLGLLASSKVARWIAAAGAGAVVLGMVFAAGRFRAAGRREGRAGVETANAAAKADRERIEASIEGRTDDEVAAELGRWSR